MTVPILLFEITYIQVRHFCGVLLVIDGLFVFEQNANSDFVIGPAIKKPTQGIASRREQKVPSFLQETSLF
jgi:hypothetical protein